MEKSYYRKIEELNREINKLEGNKENVSVDLKKYYVLLVAFILFCILMFIINDNNFVNSLTIIPIFILIGMMLKEKNDIKHSINAKNIEKKQILLKEIEMVKQDIESHNNEIIIKEQKLDKDLEKDKEKIINKYKNIVDLDYIEKNINKDLDDILDEIELKENRIQTLKFKLHGMEQDNKNIISKIEDLANVEEELTDAEEEKEELNSLNTSFNIAKECLNLAYEEVKANISPKFIENLCTIISKISDNRYTNVRVSDTCGLKVEVQNGKYEPASRLSVGTIDQMYLSLRLSALSEITDEKMPIILDEAFAYFDNERLKNMLMYIYKNYSDNQIIIFTCSNREKEILDRLKIEHNLIKLEN